MDPAASASTSTLYGDDQKVLLDSAIEMIELDESEQQKVTKLINLLQTYLVSCDYDDEIKLYATSAVQDRVVSLVGNQVSYRFLALIGDLHMNTIKRNAIAKLPAEKREEEWLDHEHYLLELFAADLAHIRLICKRILKDRV